MLRSTEKARPRLLWVAALCALAASSAQAQGNETRIVQTQGDVRVNGAPAQTGPLPAGATVQTGVDGRVQMRSTTGALLALPAGSEVRLADSPNTVALAAGGLRLSTANAEWRVNLPGGDVRSIRTNGYLKLQACGTGCALLASQPALLDDLSNQADATRVRAEVAATLKTGVEAFRDGKDDAAKLAFERVRALAPGETLVPYYLGLIALKREDNASAVQLLQQYAREDPEGATSRDVPQTLTLLSSAQLQQEVASAVARETEVVGSPPEPGSIAVQAFVNKGSNDGDFRALAKGLAAMIIADLSKVPGLKVLEREKVQLLVNEAKLGDSGLADTASAVRSGRLMRAEKVVVGNFEVQQ
jgi:TolB-like protein